jgi:hypothetical protein
MKRLFAFILLIFLGISYVFSYDSNFSSLDIFQEATDEHFKGIDEKIEQYLANLNKSKNHCFWKGKKQNFLECINDIEKFFNDYSLEYRLTCNKILALTIEKSEKESIPALEAKKFIDSKWKNLCTSLYELKIRIYKWVAYDILKDNKHQILKDENKLFTQDQRKKYSDLLDLIRVNLWYIERLWKKWPSKTKK